MHEPEIALIPVAVADSLGDLDLVVESFLSSGADVVPGVCDQTVKGPVSPKNI